MAKLDRDDIVLQPTHRLRACAMVAYILLNRARYLDEQYRLRVPYVNIAGILMKGKFHGDVLVTASLGLGLHRSISRKEAGLSMPGMHRIIMILPPAELKDLIPT
jgi:hypothetical protein